MNRITWLFQKFKVKPPKVSPLEVSFSQQEMGTSGEAQGKVRYHVAKLKNNSSVLASLKFKYIKDNDSFKRSGVNSVALLDDIKGWLKTNARDAIFDGIETLEEEYTRD